MNNRSFCAALGLLLVATGAPPAAWAGAWTLPKNRWYVEYFYRVFQSKHTFDRDGNRTRRPSAGRFRDIRNEIKLEYGLTDWWNLLVSAPYQSSHFRNDNIDLLRTGIGDVFLRSKFRIFNRPVLVKDSPMVASAQFSVKLADAYDSNENPLGDGQTDFESRLQLSQAWALGPSDTPASLHASAHDPLELMESHGTAVTREEAMREAILLAELSQQGMRLYEQREYAEAAKWFQAVLATEPSNYEVLAVVLNHGAQTIDDAMRAGLPVTVLAGATRFEPVSDRYAQVGASSSAGSSSKYDRVAFVNLEGGYTLRNGDPPNEFPMVAEAGFTPLKRLMVIGSVESIVSTEPTAHEESFAKWGLRGVYNLWGDGFASVFKTDKPTVNLELGYNDVFDGRATADAFELFTKLSVNF